MARLTVEDLLARRSIEDVIGRLARAQDRLDREGIISCFHPDGIDDHQLFAGKAPEFADWLITLLDERFEETLHFVGPPLVTVDGDLARANTQCVCHHLFREPQQVLEPGGRTVRGDYLMGLRYLDRFERRGGDWLISKRLAVYDWGYHSLFEGPIKAWHEEGMIESARDRSDPSFGAV